MTCSNDTIIGHLKVRIDRLEAKLAAAESALREIARRKDGGWLREADELRAIARAVLAGEGEART